MALPLGHAFQHGHFRNIQAATDCSQRHPEIFHGNETQYLTVSHQMAITAATGHLRRIDIRHRRNTCDQLVKPDGTLGFDHRRSQHFRFSLFQFPAPEYDEAEMNL
jgi:hypothetical protein